MKADISLRAPEPEDVDTLYGWELLPDVQRVSLSEAPVSRFVLWEYVNSYKGDIYADRQLRLVVQAGTTPIGTIDISDFSPRDGRAFLGIMIDPRYRRLGYAHEALSQAIDYCRRLGMHQLAAMVARDNEASLALFQSLGFKSAGCLRSWICIAGKYTDALILQLMLQSVEGQ